MLTVVWDKLVLRIRWYYSTKLLAGWLMKFSYDDYDELRRAVILLALLLSGYTGP